jgi:hypothetical protein
MNKTKRKIDKYKVLSGKLLNAQPRSKISPFLFRGEGRKKNRKTDSSLKKTYLGLNLSIKGRLNGVNRSRKLEFKHNGVAPNSFSSKIKSTHLPINTK